jgi:hypothetical protein
MNKLILLSTNLRPELNLYWVSFVVLFSFILLAYVKQKNNAIFTSFKSFFNFRFFRQAIREETNASKLYSRILLINSFIIIAIVLNHFFSDLFISSIDKEGSVAFLLLLLVVFFWYGVNVLVKKIIAKVSNTEIVEKEAELYNQYFFQVLGVALLPGVVGLYFFPKEIFEYDVVKGVETYMKIIIAVLLLNKLIQSIFQSFEIKISWFYIFLYICTLEILPLCIGFQLLVN